MFARLLSGTVVTQSIIMKRIIGTSVGMAAVALVFGAIQAHSQSVNYNFSDGTADGWANSGFGNSPLASISNIGGQNYIVSGRKLLLFETAPIVEWLCRVMGGGYSVRSRRNRQNSPATATLLLSDLFCVFRWGGVRPPARAFRRALVDAPAAPGQ